MQRVTQVLVSGHVVARYRQRTLGVEDQRPFTTLVEEIEAKVKDGIEKRQLLDHKPKAFRLFKAHRHHNVLPENERFVYGGEDHGFIIRKAAEDDWVVTTV